MLKIVWQFLVEEDGPTAVEYAVMLALIIAVCIAAISSLGNTASETMGNNNASIGGAFDSVGLGS